MDGNRELEQLDAEARALKATLMRYMAESLIEDQGLNKLAAELTRTVQASQRHAVESSARAEQKLQTLGGTVETLRAELRSLVTQSHEQLLREVRTLLNEQLGKRNKKTLDSEAVSEQLRRLQLELHALSRGLQARPGSARAVDHDAPTYKPRRAPRVAVLSAWGPWILAAPLAALLVISVGYNVWQARRSPEPARTTAKAGPSAAPDVSQVQAQLPSPTRPVAATVAAGNPPAAPKQTAWDGAWKKALELPMQQCWPQAKSNAQVSTFRDCACGQSDRVGGGNGVCEWSGKWSAEASIAALQAVLSVAAAKPMTIDAKLGTSTFNAIDLLVRDCGFKEPAFLQAIAELRTTRGRASDAREPAAHQILSFLKKNLSSCR